MDKENVPPQAKSNMTTQRLARTNRVLAINPRGKWSNESLEIAVDVIECGITSLQGANKFQGIPITSFSNHLSGKVESKKIEPPGVLTEKKDEVVVAWVLNMQKCGLSITLQQLKWKVAKLFKLNPLHSEIRVPRDY